MWRIPNTVAIFGNAPRAADIALRKVLKFTECSGPVVILDYTGCGAMILGETNRMSLLRRPVVWYDLADRRCPIALFQLAHSDHFRQVMLKTLRIIKDISRKRIADATLVWACEAAFNLSKNGTVGLAALLRSLSSPEIRRWFLDTRNDPVDLGQLLDMIIWSLRFPSVYAISEGVNRADLKEILQKPVALWIESRTEYFERLEYSLIAGLSEAAIEDAVRSLVAERKIVQAKTITVLHLFPPSMVLTEIPGWVKETAPLVRHIGAHHLRPDHSPRPFQISWAKNASDVWIVGKMPPLKPAAHACWLANSEIERINHLDHGELWVKSNECGKSIVARVGYTKEWTGLVPKLRQESLKRLKTMPVLQMATAAASMDNTNPGNYGLYEQLCQRENLRLGWFKVQMGRKDSHGPDNITVGMFKQNLELELSRLIEELKNKNYCCRPLRRAYILKPDGDKRPLGIACVRDRVVQSAGLILLEPIFEPTFSRYSFAFRPRRHAHQALEMVRGFIADGRSWVVIADIKKCFDNIDHEVLLDLLSKLIGDQDLLSLIRHWLTVDILDFRELVPIISGVPQGESLSPLLANIYLDPLDKHFEHLGFDFVRFADDIIVLTRSQEEAQRALKVLENFLLDPLHLELKPAKTNYVPVAGGFEFLGFKIKKDSLEVKQKRLEDIQAVLLRHIQVLGNASSTFDARVSSITRINAIIRGFRNYFVLPDERLITEQMHFLDGRTEEMAREYLPPGIRGDPAWICRERFYLSRTMEDIESEKEEEERKVKAGSGYPDEGHPVRYDPLENMDHPDDEQKVQGRPPLAADDPDEEEPKVGALNGTVVQKGDRLYVLTHGGYLTISGQDLIIKKRKTEIHRRPLSELGLVFLQGIGMNIAVNLQLRLAELDIPLVFAPPVGAPTAVLNPVSSPKSYLRSRQVLRRDDPDIIATGLNMIASKVGNQAAVLRYFSKYRKKTNSDIACQLIKASEEMRSFSDNIRSLDPGSASVRSAAMGFEGHAAAIYWRHLLKIIPPELGFNGRITRSASDAVNQCLNYTYGILYGEVWRAIVKAGLDPYFGLMHGSKRDQGSLVFDLIEEFRAPFSDRLVLGMLGRGFQPEIGVQGLLKTRTRRQLAIGFSKHWMKKMVWRSRKMSPALILEGQAESLAKVFNHEGVYHPFKMRW